MKKLRGLSLMLVVVIVFSLLSACGSSKQSSTPASTSTQATASEQTQKEASQETAKSTKITFLSGKPEIQAQLEETLKLFSEENPGIEMELVAGQANQSPYQALTVMYNSGNACSVYMMEQGDILKLKDKLADLSAENFNKDAITTALEPVTVDGKVYAAPFIVESVGILYNSKVIEEATGKAFDPNSIKSISDLEEIFKEVEAAGIIPVAVSPENWSLGAHLMMYMYASQFPNSDKNVEFTESLREGSADLINNKVFIGWLDTFDLLKKYNINKKDPLAANNDKNAALLKEGQVAFWFMGNFIWPVLQGLDADPSHFGMMPVPVSDNPSDVNNTQLLSLYSMYLCVDQAQNDTDQQAASKKFIDWILYSPSGQDQMVNKLSLVPAYKHFEIETQEPLSASLAKYIKADQTLSFNILYPSDHWQVLGGSMQKYLADQGDRAVLASEIEEYWKTAK